MPEIEKISKEIECLRTALNNLLNQKSNMVDTEIILLSQKLDNLLNEYYLMMDGNKAYGIKLRSLKFNSVSKSLYKHEKRI